MYRDIVQHIYSSQNSRDCDCKRILVTGQDSSVGIATRYGMDVPGIESRWGVWGGDFPLPSRPALGPTQPPTQWVPVLSRG